MSKRPKYIIKNLKPSEQKEIDRYGILPDLNIWNERPAFKDVNKLLIISKTGFILGIFISFAFISYYVSNLLILSFLFPSLMVIFFILIFFQDIFYYFGKGSYSGLKKIYLFKNIKFKIKDDTSDTLYIFNKKDYLITGLKIYRIDILPQTIHGNVARFLNSLDRVGVPYTYQIVQTSNIQLIEKSSEFSNIEEKIKVRNRLHKSQSSLNISLFLAISFCNKDYKFSTALEEIQNSLDNYGKVVFSSFHANYKHHHLTQLKGLELVDGIYAIFFKTKVEPNNQQNYTDNLNNIGNWGSIIIRIAYLISFLCFEICLFHSIGFNLEYNILISSFVLLIIIYVYWREVFSSLTDRLVFKNFYNLNLFNNYEFFMRSGIPKSIFVWNRKLQLLLGIKILAVNNITSHGYCDPDRFIRAIAPFKISYSYTTVQAPLSQLDIEEDYKSYMKDKVIKKMDKYYDNKEKLIGWLSMRAGIWRFMFLLSVCTYKFTSYISTEMCEKLDEQLQENFDIIYLAFKQFYDNYIPVILKTRRLLSGLKVILLKNKFVRREGTHIPYSLIQGKILKKPNKIMDELKKGIKTQVAAEFNTPLSLQNEIIIGNTINTEFFREEIPFGLLFNQIDNLIISGGTQRQRENMSMKIISELVESKVPSIIFDLKGNYSKLINKFSKTQFYHDFHYFKLGQSFNIELLSSGIKNDPNNLEYLDYISEVVGCVRKLTDKEILSVKDLFSKVQMDFTSLTLDIEMNNKWERNYIEKYIASIFKEYTQQTKNSISAIGIEEGNITSRDFLKREKTIIFDLSNLRLPLNLFAMFVLISRIIHYTQEERDYTPKLLVIPYVEYFFDKIYLEKWVKPYIIDKFLEPLRENGFGFMFLVNEINKLHPTFFDYIQNFIALKTVNPTDLKVLKNLLNLQEMQGQGYYTNTRKNTYQIDFLKQLKEDGAVVLRNDLDQPFPVKIDIDSVATILTPNYTNLSDYMKEFGYDFQKTEEQILNSIKKTIFEKDFQEFQYLLEEIISFLRTLNQIDTIGNIYEHKVKEQLLKFIRKKLIAKGYKREQINNVRNDLFRLLISHRYLVENHPREAAGSQSIRSSYSVGRQFARALKDYYDSQSDFNNQIDFRLLETNKVDINENTTKKKEQIEYFVPPGKNQQKKQALRNINEKVNKSKRVLGKSIGAFLINGTIRAGNNLNRNQYKDTILKVRDILSRFLYKLYNTEFNENSKMKISSDILIKAADYLIESNVIPFERQELYNILKKIDIKELRKGELENVARENYDILYNFTQKIIIKIAD